MPFLFKTEIKQSQIHGNGVFALEEIAQGEVYWVSDCLDSVVQTLGCQTSLNLVYTQKALQSVKEVRELVQILHGGFYYKGSDLFIELRDGAHFMNHSQDSNSQIIFPEDRDYKKIFSYASKHINAGDEITESYANYPSSDSEWLSKLMYEFLPERMAVEDSITQHQK